MKGYATSEGYIGVYERKSALLSNHDVSRRMRAIGTGDGRNSKIINNRREHI